MAGVASNCGLTGGGVAYCWGYNQRGQLGDGTTTNATAPVAVAGGLTFSSLAGGTLSNGTYQNCGLTTARAAYCWGGNDRGQLGVGTLNSASSPSMVAGGLTFATLANGGYHACGLNLAGAAYCWGFNWFGQLGDGTTTDRNVPVLVSGAPAFVALSAGGLHTCGRTAAGAVYCWDNNASGQLGNAELATGPRAVAASGIVFRAP